MLSSYRQWITWYDPQVFILSATFSLFLILISVMVLVLMRFDGIMEVLYGHIVKHGGWIWEEKIIQFIKFSQRSLINKIAHSWFCLWAFLWHHWVQHVNLGSFKRHFDIYFVEIICIMEKSQVNECMMYCCVEKLQFWQETFLKFHFVAIYVLQGKGWEWAIFPLEDLGFSISELIGWHSLHVILVKCNT